MDLSFSENLVGFICPGVTEPEDGLIKGKEKGFEASISGTITMENVDEFVTITDRTADMVGTLSVPGLGNKLSILKGTFNCYRLAVDSETDRTMKIMEYKLHFKSELDESYYLHGEKKLYHDPGKFDMMADSTTMYAKIYKGDEASENSLFASGVFKITTSAFAKMLASTRVNGSDKLMDKVEAISKFYTFFFGEAYDIYFKGLGFFYSTDYQNFVLSGQGKFDGKERQFFFYSGAHDLGFPWGTNQTFWDVSLVLIDQDSAGNNVYEQYVMADKELFDKLKLNILDNEVCTYSYSGKMYRLKEGYSVSFSDDLMQPEKSKILEPVDADIEIKFMSNVPHDDDSEVPGVIVPFGIKEGLDNPLLLYINSVVEKFTSEHKGMGVRFGIRAVEVQDAKINIGNKSLEVDKDKTWGEAEKSTIKYVKEPTLKYSYFCGVNPEEKKIMVHTTGGVLFNDAISYPKSVIDHLVSAIARPFNSTQVKVIDKKLQKIDRKPKPLTIKDDYVLEVNYDHYETAVFQRRIVLLRDRRDKPMFALEEDMKRINLKRIEAASKDVTDSPLDNDESVVAVFKSTMDWPTEWQDPAEDKPGIIDNLLGAVNILPGFKGRAKPEERMARENEDKCQLLHKVVQETNFFDALYKRAEKLGRKKADLRIVIKPNFMFLYDRYDRTTYTDPVLVKELAAILYDEGFTNITVVEAQSTYGNYFQNRGVVNVAEYIGLLPADKYKVVDLSDESQWVEPEKPFTGPLKTNEKLGATMVPKIWQDADFRISFPKNKTHCYAYYTLAIKCIYGALPVQNKYHEYHCNRGIYGSTIEYLRHYPIHFGFIDAYVSSDGPFGVFANKIPNYTRTIIGGENIVAVDWIGASKMGIDPMVSEFMKKAVRAFGKPRIMLKGDLKHEMYDPWINVPKSSADSMNDVVDKSYQFGNAFTNAMMSVDTKAFPPKKSTWWMKLIRFFDAPMRTMVFGNHKILKERYGNDPMNTMLFGGHSDLKKAYEQGPLEEINASAYEDIEIKEK